MGIELNGSSLTNSRLSISDLFLLGQKVRRESKRGEELIGDRGADEE
jgi:hypothetical protein